MKKTNDLAFTEAPPFRAILFGDAAAVVALRRGEKISEVTMQLYFFDKDANQIRMKRLAKFMGHQKHCHDGTNPLSNF